MNLFLKILNGLLKIIGIIILICIGGTINQAFEDTTKDWEEHKK